MLGPSKQGSSPYPAVTHRPHSQPYHYITPFVSRINTSFNQKPITSLD